METLAQAMIRLFADGYTQDFSAVAGGDLRCGDCKGDHQPEAMSIDEIVRFEGDSNPDDEAILLALRCTCGLRGLYTSAYGSGASANDVEALKRFAQA